MEPRIGLLVGREWSFPPAFLDPRDDKTWLGLVPALGISREF